MTVTLSLDIVLQILVAVLSIGAMWGVMRSQLNGLHKTLGEIAPLVAKVPQLELRLAAVEGNNQKIDQIAPLMERVTQFETRIQDQVGNIRSDVKDLASAVRDLARTRAA